MNSTIIIYQKRLKFNFMIAFRHENENKVNLKIKCFP